MPLVEVGVEIQFEFEFKFKFELKQKRKDKRKRKKGGQTLMGWPRAKSPLLLSPWPKAGKAHSAGETNRKKRNTGIVVM